MGYVAAFAKTGDPNRNGLPRWLRYDATRSELMMFTLDGTAVMQTDPWKARLDLVERAHANPVTGQPANRVHHFV